MSDFDALWDGGSADPTKPPKSAASASFDALWDQPPAAPQPAPQHAASFDAMWEASATPKPPASGTAVMRMPPVAVRPALPVAAPSDMTRVGAPPRSEGTPITTPVVKQALKYGLDPMLNNPLTTVITQAVAGPLGEAAVGALGLRAAAEGATEAAPSLLSRIGMGAARNAAAGAAVNAPVGAIEGAVSAPSGQRLRGAAAGALAAGATGAAAGAVMGGATGAAEGVLARRAAQAATGATKPSLLSRLSDLMQKREPTPAAEPVVDEPPTLATVEQQLQQLRTEHAQTPDTDPEKGGLASRINVLEAQRRAIAGEPEPPVNGTGATTTATPPAAAQETASEAPTTETPAPAPEPAAGRPEAKPESFAGRRAKYGDLATDDLTRTLADEQRLLESHADNPMRAGWARIDDYGNAITGGSLSGGIANQQIKFASSRIDAIEAELARRGLSPDEIAEHRFGSYDDTASFGDEATSFDDLWDEPKPNSAPEPALVGATAGTDPRDAMDLDAVEERHSGLSLPRKAVQAIKTGYRDAVRTPYAAAEQQAPELVAALNRGGAAAKRAEDIASYRVDRLFRGLTDEQQEQFGQRLLLDNLDAEAQRKAATDPDAAARFQAHADQLRPNVPPGVENEPWFQQTLGLYKSSIEKPLTHAALQAGVDPNDLRPTQLAYMKLASTKRLDDQDILNALRTAGVKDVSELQQRPALVRKLIGENPNLARYFAAGAPGPRQGPVQSDVGSMGFVRQGPETQTTGSARMAQGTAAEYSPDLRRILAVDTREKLLKAENNNVLDAITKIGRKLGRGEAAKPDERVLAFDRKNVVFVPDDPEADPTSIHSVQRYAVTPEVEHAVKTYYGRQNPAPPSTSGAMIRKASDLATRAQISGMPVEATSHALNELSLTAGVPGEKDLTGKIIAAVPMLGGKVATAREAIGLDFSDPETIALRDRLADIGAMRVQPEHGGLLNSSSRFLFGPEGWDARMRLVLARKYLAKAPDATDEALRDFITSKVGNYVPQNAATLSNFLAKGSFISPFARFQTARIPTAFEHTAGVSGLPTQGIADKLGDVASTLYRGPVGHVVGGNALNYALTGHLMFNNERGHDLDVQAGFGGKNLYAVPGGTALLSDEEARQMGDKASPLYVPGSTINSPMALAMRVAGPLVMPNRENSSRLAEAERGAVNTALSMTGPFARAATAAFLGKAPYVEASGDLLSVVPHRFDRNTGVADKAKAALAQANPAVHAFAETGGSSGRTLANAMHEDGKPLGGAASAVARVAEFTMPRVLTASVGGRTNEQSDAAQQDRVYREALQDYHSAIRRAGGPEEIRQIIADAETDARRARRDGLAVNPDQVVNDLNRFAARQSPAVQNKNREQVKARVQRRRAAAVP